MSCSDLRMTASNACAGQVLQDQADLPGTAVDADTAEEIEEIFTDIYIAPQACQMGGEPCVAGSPFFDCCPPWYICLPDPQGSGTWLCL